MARGAAVSKFCCSPIGAHASEVTMSDPTNLTRDAEAGEPPERRDSRPLPNFDFDTPDEDSMQLLEESWGRFCRSIGLDKDIPDIRAILAARKTSPPPQRRPHWLVRPFVAIYDRFTRLCSARRLDTED